MTLSIAGTREAATTEHLKLSGRRLILVRSIWAATVFLALLIFILAIRPEYDRLHTTFCAAQAQDLDQIGLNTDFCAAYFTGFEVLFALPYCIVAGIIFWRKSTDWMGMLASLMLIVLGVSYWFLPDALMALQPAWTVPIIGVETLSAVLVLAFLYLFPDGRFIPPWTRYVLIFFAIWGAMWPFSQSLNLAYWPPITQIPVFVSILGSGIYAQIFRYRNESTRAQRQQTKWIVVGLVAAFIGWAGYQLFDAIFSGGVDNGSPVLFYLIARPISGICEILMPVTIGVALLRYRLWDVDFVINRSLVYGTLTVALGFAYFLSVLLLQQVFQAVTGGQQSSIAIATSTLVIALSFQPMRQRFQRLIDNRVYHGLVPVPLNALPKPATDISPIGFTLSGKQIGAYEILEPLGRGGMAEVYKGQHSTLKRTVAIKILPPDKTAEDFRKRFEREAQTVAALRHPNIVQMFDFGNIDGTYYMVMEYIAGQDLAQYMRSSGAMSLEQARPFIVDIASALDYAHSEGLVHRDVKPSNVMLQPTTQVNSVTLPYRAILMDFGIAKILSGNTAMTKTGMMGTLDYIAPEQIMSSKEVDRRADIYALGVIVFELLTGQLPFKGDNPGTVLFGHLQLPPPDPRKLNPAIAPEVAAAILRALAKAPADRFATAGDLAKALS